VIDDVPEDFLVDSVHLTGRGLIDRIEQRRKRVAQAEATATAVADVEHALEFLLERGFVIERRIAPIDGMAGGGFEAALASGGVLRTRGAQIESSAFWKRLA
jgi:hypothetical protein